MPWTITITPCLPHWLRHSWEPWREIERGVIQVWRHGQLFDVGSYIYQERQCSVCKRKQVDKQQVL